MKILIVDDNENNRCALRAWAESINSWQCETAANGVEALERLKSRRIDLVITDILMPEMDGFQLCYHIKTNERMRSIPVIFYTATYPDSKDEELGLSLGAEDYILKPTRPDEFHDRVRKVLARVKAEGTRNVTLLQPSDEVKYLREYSARVVHKLESKVQEVDEANRRLAELNATLDQRVQEKTAQLQEVNRELEAFSYSLSHDMRAPLRAIQSYASIVLDEFGANFSNDGRAAAEKIVSSAQRLDRLIKDVLTLSRLSFEEIKIQAQNVEALLREIISESPEFQEPKAQVRVEGPLPPVLAQSSLLTQCFSNLLGNAVKFVERGVKPQVRVFGQRQAGRVRIVVEDNGIGIDGHGQQRLFQLFQRNHRNADYEGTGVGLAIVRRAVERMHGQAGVESEPGKGSRFWIELTEAKS
jgi:signal transduction histidine kinase